MHNVHVLVYACPKSLCGHCKGLKQLFFFNKIYLLRFWQLTYIIKDQGKAKIARNVRLSNAGKFQPEASYILAEQ